MPEEHVGKVTHFFNKIGVATVRLDKSVRKGEVWHVVGEHDNVTFKVKEMQMEHDPIDSATKGEEVGVKVPDKVHENSEVLRVTQK